MVIPDYKNTRILLLLIKVIGGDEGDVLEMAERGYEFNGLCYYQDFLTINMKLKEVAKIDLMRHSVDRRRRRIRKSLKEPCKSK